MLFLIISFLSLFIQFSFSVVVLGSLMLSICMLIFFILALSNLFWYGIIFLLINVGGSMVLFYYMFSLQANPLSTFSFLSKIYFFLSLLVFFVFFLEVNTSAVDLIVTSFSVEDVSFFLFSLNELSLLVFISLFLVLVLLIISILTSSIMGSFRLLKII
uniref:NADH dehydrogenase subunit 6 n=1 Tax=Bipalium admarginatum TaxID=3023024 RepID=UPI002410E79B|nr:NADH dehydrogenase subunit 6 [Bipalium admarginatum]WEM34728.1 NADH dehydrogenase subunit 6 [Bipalium admarginatum]